MLYASWQDLEHAIPGTRVIVATQMQRAETEGAGEGRAPQRRQALPNLSLQGSRETHTGITDTSCEDTHEHQLSAEQA